MATLRTAFCAQLDAHLPQPHRSDSVLAVHPFLESVLPLALAMGGDVVPVDQLKDGDIPLRWEDEVVGGFRAGGLDGALDRLIEQIERERGVAVTDLDRAGKQSVVHRLDELGAFTLRKAVEDIADRLEVSRFTVYNYLNAQHALPVRPSAPAASTDTASTNAASTDAASTNADGSEGGSPA